MLLKDVVDSVFEFEGRFTHGFCHDELVKAVLFLGYCHGLLFTHLRGKGFDSFEGGVDGVLLNKFVDFVAFSDYFLDFFGQVLSVINF